MAPHSTIRVPHFLRRWWPVVVLVAGVVGWLFFTRTPRLRPVTVRRVPTSAGFLFSAEPMGYPVLEYCRAATPPFRSSWLDARCQPRAAALRISGQDEAVASPHGNYVAWVSMYPGYKRHVSLLTPGAAAPVVRGYVDPHIYQLCWVSDAGAFYLDSGKLAEQDGKPLPIPPGYLVLPRFTSADARYLVLEESSFTHLVLYDLQQRRVVLTHPFRGMEKVGMVFTAGNRVLFLPADGQASVYQGTTLLKTVGTAVTQWHWGEDGSAWTLDGRQLRILRWRTGTPALTPCGKPQEEDARFGSIGYPYARRGFWLHSRQPDWAAVWGDGKLIAVTETRTYLRPPLKPALETVRRLVGITTPFPQDVRRLTLYRDGKRAGVYTIPRPTPDRQSMPVLVSVVPGTAVNVEHLAFTEDGTHLSWLLSCGEGWQVYAFEMKD